MKKVAQIHPQSVYNLHNFVEIRPSNLQRKPADEITSEIAKFQQIYGARVALLTNGANKIEKKNETTNSNTRQKEGTKKTVPIMNRVTRLKLLSLSLSQKPDID